MKLAAHALGTDRLKVEAGTSCKPNIGENKMTKACQDIDTADHNDAVPLLAKSISTVPAPLEEIGGDKYYVNRELSWLEFNKRVLSEADNDCNPLLERIKFLAIADSNIDDFYMKRIGGLKQQIGAGIEKVSVDGRSPKQQVSECVNEIRLFQARAVEIRNNVLAKLENTGIRLCQYNSLDEKHRERLSKIFRKKILPLITPLPIDANTPLPFISNLSVNLLVQFRRSSSKKLRLARIKLPDSKVVPRFVRVSRRGHDYVLIEDIISNHLDLVFPSMQVLGTGLFRITRNAISDMDTAGANDLLEVIESQLRTRKFAPVVRLQTSPGLSSGVSDLLAGKLQLRDSDIFADEPLLGISDLMELARIEMPELLNAPHVPINNTALPTECNIFESIREAGTILLQHPYESFVTSVTRLIRTASNDPKVLSIKMTLYRTSSDSKIIKYLINAVQNGKQVAVVIELQARNDEAANIKWADRLKQAGIHVNCGVLGVKTHCKTIQVVRHEEGVLRRYSHFGTGNYHAGTARLYSDVGLLTCDEVLADDLANLFNYLTTRWSIGEDYSQMLIAPQAIKKTLLANIKREIALHSADTPGLLRLKTNALEDVDVVRALYQASQAGVKVELLVRDICRLRPGVKGLSENIKVTSIVGRFLEHSRVYFFGNGGNHEYYIGSADLMGRNLERRVELLVPVNDADARDQLKLLFKNQLSDNRNAWQMNSDGSYRKLKPTENSDFTDCHEMAIQAALIRMQDENKRAAAINSVRDKQ